MVNVIEYGTLYVNALDPFYTEQTNKSYGGIDPF